MVSGGGGGGGGNSDLLFRAEAKLLPLDDFVSINDVVAMFDITGNAFNLFAGVLVNVCKRTCCDLEFMLSADSFMEAMDCVVARRSFGNIRWNRSGDSSGLVAAEPSVAFTRKLSK